MAKALAFEKTIMSKGEEVTTTVHRHPFPIFYIVHKSNPFHSQPWGFRSLAAGMKGYGVFGQCVHYGTAVGISLRGHR